MRSLFVTAALLTATTTAWAQDDGMLEIDGDVVLTAGATDDDFETDIDGRLTATASTTAFSPLEIGAVTGLRFDSDQPDFRALGGRYSSFAAGGPRGIGRDSDLYIDRAYVFAKGGFGSFSVGQQEGVAAQLAVTSPTIFRALGVNDWRADPSGLNDVNTVNDFSGTAPKINYMPPPGFLGGVIGNLQLGVSYAPQFDGCDGDECDALGSSYAMDTSGQIVPQDGRWRDVSEAALYYQNGFALGGDRLTLGLGASYVQADEEQSGRLGAADLLEDYEALALGLNLAYGDITIGGSVKTTNAGIDESMTGPSDYLAFDAGITYTAGDWKMMLGYGQADAERDASLLIGPSLDVAVPFALDRRTQTAQAGIAYVLGHGVTLGAAAQYVDSDKPDMLGGKEDTAAVMIESSIRF